MKNKQIKAREVKLDDEAGSIKLVFGTMNVIDHDGDVTIPGAIGEPQKVRMSAYNHSSWGQALPVGKGTVYESGEDMVFEGKFFLSTEIGRETYETVKAMGDLQEYSYGFDITEAGFGQFGPDDQDVQFINGVKIYEVSPVLLGAGVDTRTLDVKNKDSDGDGEGNSDAEDVESMTVLDHAKSVLDAVGGFTERLQKIATLRQEEGKTAVSEKNIEPMNSIVTELNKAANEVAGLLVDPDEDTVQEINGLMEQLDIREAFDD